MPYAPGVQDISGQLRAAGIAQAGQAWSQAIGNIAKDVGDAFQTYKQNQFITNQAMGQIAGYTRANPDVLRYLEGAASEDPNAPSLSPEVLKSYANLKSGNPKMQDAAVVKSFIDAYDKNKQSQLQTQMMQFQVEKAKRESDFWKSIGGEQLGATPVGAAAPAAAPAPAVAAPAGVSPQMLRGFAGIPAAEIGRYGAQVAPGGQPAALEIGRYGAPGAVQAAPQAAPTPAPAAAQGPVAAAGFAQAIPTRQDVITAINNNLISPSSSQAQIRMAVQKIADERAKAANLERVSYQDPQKAQEAFDQLDQTNPIPGYRRVPKFIPEIRGYAMEMVERKKTGAELAAEAGLAEKQKKIAEAEIEEAKTYEGSINNAASSAIDERARFNRIRQLYNQGTPSGPFSAYTLGLRSTFSELGLGDPTKIAGEKELRALLARSALNAARTFYKGQGAVDREERRRIDVAIEAFDNGRITNEQLMNLAEAQNEKLIAASDLSIKLQKQKVPMDERGLALREWWMKNPLDNFLPGPEETYVLNPDGALVKKPKPVEQQAAPSVTTPQGYSMPSGWKAR